MEVNCATRSWKNIRQRERETTFALFEGNGWWLDEKSAVKTNSSLLQDHGTHPYAVNQFDRTLQGGGYQHTHAYKYIQEKKIKRSQ